jgi:hypothetical protein
MGYTPSMVGFFIKKSFFDGWDNLFSLVLLNLGFLVALAIGLLLPSIQGMPVWAGVIFAVIAIAAGSVLYSASVYAMVAVADFKTFHAGEAIAMLKRGLVPGLQSAVALILGWIIVSIGLPFYAKTGAMLGAVAGGILFWFAVIALLALQYYVPLRARLGGGLKKNLRKSFLIFFDNPGFSLFLFIYSVVTLLLSGLLAFLAPGFAGVALEQDIALRLRLYKYDWLEANPGAKRRDIPWDELLTEDRDLVGKRTLKGMIFPWKE